MKDDDLESALKIHKKSTVVVGRKNNNVMTVFNPC